MRIKKVVIQGFKTFARRTEFLFDPGITAVVGPNGSGKSNVVDAVRWCLGEQSFAMLRSKKTSDVIFSGSDKKARLSMAEVTLTLDNSGGELPIAFAELEITRRAYRDGDNEYLINGKKVRLQDIVELLAQTGLGRRTYSVVGQGLIDRALSLAPEERRALFEEAAGITGYQLKRSSAVRRLEATRLNLTRIVDITTELAPRLSLLKRQADRTRERERVATDLKLLLREWYGFRWHRTLKQVEDQVAVELQLRTAVVNRQEELALAGGEIEQQRLRQSELRGEVGGLHGRRSELHREAEQINRQLAVVEERMRQLTDRSEESRRELVPLQAQESMLAERRTALEQELAAAREAATERSDAAEEIQQAVGRRQQQRRTTQDAVDNARKALKQVQDQVADVGSRLAQTGERAITLLAEQQRQQEMVAKLESESTAAEQRLRECELSGQQLEQQAATLQATLKTSEDEGNRLRVQLKSAEEARQAAERMVDRLQTRFDLLNRLRNEGAGYAGGVRTIIQAAATDRRLAGILGTVASQIRVPGELEKAVETALGGALQNVIVRRWDDAATAIDWLKQNRAGRATFLPLDRLHVQQPIPAPRLAGVLGVAADLVDFDRSVETAVEHLLNRTWIVQTLDVGRRALDTLGGGPRPTVVTTDGDIIRPGGAVSGGSDTSRNDDSLLTRERELRDLPAQITVAQTTAREAVAVCGQLARAIEAVRLQDTQQRQSVADLARRDRQQRQSVDESRRQWDRSREALRWQQERLEQLAGEESVLASRRDGLQVMLASLQADEAAAQSRLSATESELAAAGADDLLQELAQRRAAAAEAQGDLRSRQALLETVGRNWQAVTEQIVTKEQRLATLEEESGRLQSEIDRLTTEQQRLNRQLDALQREASPLETALAAMEQAMQTVATRERQLQNALRKDEGLWNTAQLHLQRFEDGLHQLRNEIEQDLGLVSLEYSEDVAYQPPLPWSQFVEQLPVLESVPETLEGEVREMRTRLSRIGSVNPDAPQEYAEAAERHEFLLAQTEDLEAAAGDLHKIIKELDERMETELRRTFEAVNKEFGHFFSVLFNGGTAHLELTEPDSIATSGIEIIARPPGKRPQSLALLSGGERSLSACALIFAILRVSPTPFCIMDEVDAALDEANVDRFRLTVEELCQETQFIIVTHNRRTLEGANTIYGITMGNDGVSRVMSLRLEGDKMVRHGDGKGEAIPTELMNM